MPIEPTTEYRMVLASVGIVGGLVLSTLYIVIAMVVRRRGTHVPILVFPAGLVVIALGFSASAAVRLVGLTQGMDTSYLVLGIQVGAVAIALAFLTIGLVRQRRGTLVR